MRIRIQQLFLLALVFSTVSLWGQTFRGGVTGVVDDVSGSAVPGASVQLIDTGTGLTRAATTFELG